MKCKILKIKIINFIKLIKKYRIYKHLKIIQNKILINSSNKLKIF